MSSRKNVLQLSSKYFKAKCKNAAKRKIALMIANNGVDRPVPSVDRPVPSVDSTIECEATERETVYNDVDTSIEQCRNDLVDTDTERESDNDTDTGKKSDNDTIDTNSNDEQSLTNSELKHELAAWSIKHNVSISCANQMLHILRRAGLSLPIDIRTLRKCPKPSSVQPVSIGSFVYFGIKDHLKEFLLKNVTLKTVNLTFNVDGLPLNKCNNSQVWPILCYASDTNNEEISPVFAVAIFHGNTKPPIDEYFREFVLETKNIVNEGYVFEGNTIEVNIRAFICDAPAKSYCTGVKSHNAYFGCSKCTQEGVYVQNRVTYPDCESELRTDVSFAEHRDEDHHKYVSPLEEINFGMVTCFPLDYMHLICLGVMKKTIGYWMSGRLACRLSETNKIRINKRIKNISDKLPAEFNRRLRPIDDFGHWKATELRSFLLYYGQFVLKNILEDNFYKHFLQLSVALNILASPKRQHEIEKAHNILCKYVHNFGVLYGKQALIYNVHNLLHIADDCKLFGAVDTFSAFPFENYLKDLKELVTGGSLPLQQIANKIQQIKHFCSKDSTSRSSKCELQNPARF